MQIVTRLLTQPNTDAKHPSTLRRAVRATIQTSLITRNRGAGPRHRWSTILPGIIDKRGTPSPSWQAQCLSGKGRRVCVKLIAGPRLRRGRSATPSFPGFVPQLPYPRTIQGEFVISQLNVSPVTDQPTKLEDLITRAGQSGAYRQTQITRPLHAGYNPTHLSNQLLRVTGTRLSPGHSSSPKRLTSQRSSPFERVRANFAYECYT